MNTGSILSILSPGTTVLVPQVGLRVVVRPVGIIHLRRFGGIVATLIKRFVDTDLHKLAASMRESGGSVTAEGLQQRAGADLIDIMVPVLTGDGLELIGSCCSFEPMSEQELADAVESGDLDAETVARIGEAYGEGGVDVRSLSLFDMPHESLPGVATAWALESFGNEKKRRPWAAAIEKAVERATGKPFSISGAFSRISSPPDTGSGESSTSGSQDSPTTDGAGRSSSSGSGR